MVCIMDNDHRVESAKRELASHLTCVVCSTLTTRTVQCANAHAHCFDCQRRMKAARIHHATVCSVCRCRKGWSSTRPLVDVASVVGLLVECEDCGQTFSIDEIDIHRAVCPEKRFRCPFDCEVDFTLSDLAVHALTHRRLVRTIEAGMAVNFVLQAVEIPRICYVVFETHLISMRFNMRPSSRNGMSVEIMAGVFGNPGSKSEVMLRIVCLDLANDNSIVQTNTLEVVDDDDYIPFLPSILCFDNFLCEPLPELVHGVGAPWDRRVFRAHCPGLTTDEENDACRIAAFYIQIEKTQRSIAE